MKDKLEWADIGFAIFFTIGALGVLGLGAYGMAYWYTCGIVCGP